MNQTTAAAEEAHHAELANRDEADALRNGQTVSLLQRLRTWWAGDDAFRLPVLEISMKPRIAPDRFYPGDWICRMSGTTPATGSTPDHAYRNWRQANASR